MFTLLKCTPHYVKAGPDLSPPGLGMSYLHQWNWLLLGLVFKGIQYYCRQDCDFLPSVTPPTEANKKLKK